MPSSGRLFQKLESALDNGLIMAISHLGEKIDDCLKNEAVDVKYINIGMTPLLQYLDTHANKPLKDGMKEKWEEWFAHREVDFT